MTKMEIEFKNTSNTEVNVDLLVMLFRGILFFFFFLQIYSSICALLYLHPSAHAYISKQEWTPGWKVKEGY